MVPRNSTSWCVQRHYLQRARPPILDSPFQRPQSRFWDKPFLKLYLVSSLSPKLIHKDCTPKWFKKPPSVPRDIFWPKIAILYPCHNGKHEVLLFSMVYRNMTPSRILPTSCWVQRHEQRALFPRSDVVYCTNHVMFRVILSIPYQPCDV